MKKFFRLCATTILAVVTGGVLLPVNVSAETASFNQGTVTVTQTGSEITIENNALKRTFSIANQKLTTGTIEDKLSGSTFSPGSGSEEFVIHGLAGAGERSEPENPLTSVKTESTGGTQFSATSTDTSEFPLKAENAVDNDETSFWASTAADTNPYFQVTFDVPTEVAKVRYLPRWHSDAKYNCTGRIIDYKVSYQTKEQSESEEWTELTGTFSPLNDTDGWQEVSLTGENNTPVTIVALRFGAQQNGGYHWDTNKGYRSNVINIGELQVLKSDNTSAYTTGKAGWSISGTSVSTKEGGGYAALLDGNVDTWYHSNYGQGEGTVSTLPVDLIIDRGDTAGDHPFQTLGYRPRKQQGSNGNIVGYEIYTSNDRDSLFTDGNKRKTGTFDYTGVYDGSSEAPRWIYTSLEQSNTDRYVGLRVTSSTGLTDDQKNKYVAGTGLDLFTEKFDSVSAAAYEAPTINASALTLQSVTDEETTAELNGVSKHGHLITFTFAPVTYGHGEMTIRQKVVMYDGDFFLRKFLEIENSDKTARIDYIDGEHLVTNSGDKTWTVPTNAGGVVAMDTAKANLGQPIYINGMFFGSEFPAADTQIVSSLGRARYYTGKNFDDFARDGQLTSDGKYVSWQTVCGASRSNGSDQSVVQQDFFAYIDSIATPTDFRIQYNSWFDNMMRITDDNILSSFQAVDQNLSETGVRPLESYVVDDGWNQYRQSSGTLSRQDDIEKNGPATDVNTEGFWQFNSKFPQGFTPSSELVQAFGSNFGVWIGPRGGYNYNSTLADIITAAGNGSKAGGSIDVADSRYVKKFQEMAIQWMKDYKVNYWKWDGFADRDQYNAFASGEGVVGYDEAHQHMYGGPNGFYHSTDLWEKWIVLFKNVRQAEKDLGIKKLWISLTCYVNPSPWYLQWANSVWIQCIGDRGEVYNTTLNNKMDKMLTYRDACYYDFVVRHQFQFPLANLYNHDPIYGKEGTGINTDPMTGDQFRNYLYMMGTRGTAFWELYYSDSLMDEEKYLVNADFLAWEEANFDKIRNAKMIGGTPAGNTYLSSGTLMNANGETQDAYGFAGFNDAGEGIVSMRNPSSAAKTISFTLNAAIGAKTEGTYYVKPVHTYVNSGTATAAQASYAAGSTVTMTLQPGETQVWELSLTENTSKPTISYVRAEDDNTLQVQTDIASKDLSQVTVKVNGEEATVANTSSFADWRTRTIKLSSQLKDGEAIEVTLSNGNVSASGTGTYHSGSLLAAAKTVTSSVVADASRSVDSPYGFTVSAEVTGDTSAKKLVYQGDQYALGIDENGHPYFEVLGTRAVSSKTAVEGMIITGVRENNGLLKLYVDGKIDTSAYDAEDVKKAVTAAEVRTDLAQGSVTDIRIYDRSLGYGEVPQSTLSQRITELEALKEQVTSDSWTNANMESLLQQAKTVADGNDSAAKHQALENLNKAYLKLVPDSTARNLALNKPVEAAWRDPKETAAYLDSGRPLSDGVDGRIELDNYSIYGNDAVKKSSYITIDLQDVYTLSQVKLYRYWDGRTYDSTALVVSETADFKNPSVLYYSGTTDVHGLNVTPKDQFYKETQDGKVLYQSSDGTGVKARYVRLYGYGRSDNNASNNHVNEIQVFGSKPTDSMYDLMGLKKLIDQANVLAKNDIYTATSKTQAADAVSAGQEVYNAVAANTQTDKSFGYVENAKEALRAAIAGMVEKTEATWTTEPKAVNDLKYTGNVQDLVTAGASSEGTVLYALGAGNFSEAIPQATNAGTYTVRWYVKGDGDHKDSQVQELTVSIANADGTKVTVQAKATGVNDDSYEPSITVTYDGKQLGSNEYDVKLEENAREQYTGKAIITLKGNYSGTLETTFALNTYAFVKAPAANWSSGDYVMEVNASVERFNNFGKVYVDGKEIDRSNYKVTKGSTIITISSSFMKKLSAGSHTIEALYKDGTASVKVTVPSSEKPNSNAKNSAKPVYAAPSSVKAMVPATGAVQ